MPIPAQKNVSLGPSLTQQTQHPLDDGGVLTPGGPFPRTQHGSNELARYPFEEKQWQVAVVPVVVVVKRELLLPVRGIF